MKDPGFAVSASPHSRRASNHGLLEETVSLEVVKAIDRLTREYQQLGGRIR